YVRLFFFFFFSSRRRHTRSKRDWSSDVCSSDLVHKDLGGNVALDRLRQRLRKRGLQLMLDFVPNHTGLDHPWVENHPEYYIAGRSEERRVGKESRCRRAEECEKKNM